MKEMKKYKDLTDREWEELASLLSGENDGKEDLLNRFMAEDVSIMEKWKGLRSMDTEGKIDVDKAWNKVYSRMQENSTGTVPSGSGIRMRRTYFLRIAAVAIILIGLGALSLYIASSSLLNRKITVASASNQINLRVDLPDGSKVFLNRDSKLTYRSHFKKDKREVNLAGEAFFEISPDASKPFIIDAGGANVKVVGTSFNVITRNASQSVEVFVKTGKVMLSDKSGGNSMILDPGYIGKIDSGKSEKTLNNDPNYLSWNTGRLVYNGEKLAVVFRDLKKVYNMDVVADDPSILEETWTVPTLDYQPQDRIIQLICLSFTLSYTKDGDVYHISRK
jgi:ferric-dicitrate binding protein FerR (iron transport regulator)